MNSSLSKIMSMVNGQDRNDFDSVIANATDGVAHTQHGANIRPMEHSRSNTREHERVRKR